MNQLDQKFAAPRPATALVGMVAILAVATALRFKGIGADCYWIDEIFTLQTSAGNGLAHERLPADQWIDPPVHPTSVWSGGGVRGIIEFAREDTQAPLYFMLVNLWRRIAGSSAGVVRALSAVCSLGVVISIFTMARTLTRIGTGHARDAAPAQTAGLFAGLAGAAITAIAAGQILFAQEARPYAMALLLVGIAATTLVTIEARGFSTVRGAVLGLSLLLLMLTHYTGAAPAVAMFVYTVIRLRAGDRWKTVLTFVAAGCMFAAIWGPTVLKQVGQPGQHLAFLADDPHDHALRTLDRVVRQPVVALLGIAQSSSRGAGELWMMRAAGAALIVLPLWLMRKRREFLLAWLLMMAPIVMTSVSDLLSLRQALELPRFTILSSIGVIALLALLISATKPHVAATLAIGLIAILAVLYARANGEGKPDIRPMAAMAASRVGPGDALIIARARDAPWQAGALYSTLSHYAGPWPGPMIVLDAPADSSTIARVRNAPGAWMLSPTRELPVRQLLGEAAAVEKLTVQNLGTLGRIEFAPSTQPQ